ncbi:DJ-1 protein-PfpI domain-containing protein [Mycena indigotica]|uniref:DJ-1 protein-PfpI domain-containing protein n=1 Tax=Mycena indigotica TaxID=2126181 RepID=A0A8H6SR24_9AGAR|nr:DJ-1 protein-PfpI domain-containing protein [Mycena indigotica]KAF7303921.1 DJ-1 protein-PfpI domain-containing protein [Mycena indigotica]
MPDVLSIAVCMPDGVTLSDFIPPMEILAMVNLADHPEKGTDLREAMGGDLPIRFTIDYLAASSESVVPLLGSLLPSIKPTLSYGDALEKGKQFDILWVPAGRNPNFATGAHPFPEIELAFIKQQALKARYVMSVCTGAHQLALAGVLSGKRATTNKQFFKGIVSTSPQDITWIAKARWVVDGKQCFLSLSKTFIEQLTNKKVTQKLRGAVEIPEVSGNDDEFADFWGLLQSEVPYEMNVCE